MSLCEGTNSVSACQETFRERLPSSPMVAVTSVASPNILGMISGGTRSTIEIDQAMKVSALITTMDCPWDSTRSLTLSAKTKAPPLTILGLCTEADGWSITEGTARHPAMMVPQQATSPGQISVRPTCPSESKRTLQDRLTRPIPTWASSPTTLDTTPVNGSWCSTILPIPGLYIFTCGTRALVAQSPRSAPALPFRTDSTRSTS